MKPGETFLGRYDIVRVLGQGGMGTVYEARDTKLAHHVAIKITGAEGSTYGELKARLAREARIGHALGKLDGIVRALDWGELEGHRLYLIMDLIEGGHPLDLMAGNRPVPERIRLVAQAASILSRVHASGIVHRDIKPGNYLMSKRGKLYLTDFGVAKILGEESASAESNLLTSTGSLLGTPTFMAPEQFEDPTSVDARADLYALGVMLFYALSGRYPYEGSSSMQVLSKQLSARHGMSEPPSVRAYDSRVTKTLDDLCKAALELEPSRRIPSADAFVERLTGRRLRISSSETQRIPAEFLKAELKDAMASSKRERHPPPTTRRWRRPKPTHEELGLGDDGFTSRESLRELRRRLGPAGLERLLGGTPALCVIGERPLRGVTHYLSQVAFLLQRPESGSAPNTVVLGRSIEHGDLALRLPTVSNGQVRFFEERGRWSVQEGGSKNGTQLNGAVLDPLVRQPLHDGDVIYLSRHVSLEFRVPASLVGWLGEGP